jgi:hypothetical protein
MDPTLPRKVLTMTPEQTAALAASRTWQCPLAQILTDDLTNLFPWAHQHALVLVGQPGKRNMIVAVDRNGKPFPFPNQTNPLVNLGVVNGLLQREGVRLPEAMQPETLADTLRSLLRGPGGFVGSSRFWDQEKGHLRMWTGRSSAGGPELFRRHCRDPRLQHSDRGWTLEFSYFTPQGGVEAWEVAGDAERILQAIVTPAVPNKTFLVPYV